MKIIYDSIKLQYEMYLGVNFVVYLHNFLGNFRHFKFPSYIHVFFVLLMPVHMAGSVPQLIMDQVGQTVHLD